MKARVHCTLIPKRFVPPPPGSPGEGGLVFAVVLTPVCVADGSGDGLPEVFHDWPAKAAVPVGGSGLQPFVAGKLSLEIRAAAEVAGLSGPSAIVHAEAVQYDLDWWAREGINTVTSVLRGQQRSAPGPAPFWNPPPPRPEEFRRAIWQTLIKDCGVAPVSAPRGATQHSAGYAYVGDDGGVRNAVRDGLHTVEGITSSKINPVIADMLRALVRGKAYPPENDPATHVQLQAMRYALERHDQLGSSGAASIDASPPAKAGGPKDADRAHREFHTIFSALGDHPVLLRLAGWIFDVRVPVGDLPVAVRNKERFVVRGQVALGGELVACDSPATHGWLRDLPGLDRTRLFTPAPQETDPARAELLDGIFLNMRGHVESTQWDVVAGLRSALRYDQAAQDKKEPPAFPDLLSHGITLHYKAPATPQAGAPPNQAQRTQEALRHQYDLSRSAPAKDEWFAEHLVRGYAVDACAQQADWPVSSNFTRWHELGLRDVVYDFGDLGRFGVNDRACLSTATAVGKQPISGWLMGRVTNAGAPLAVSYAWPPHSRRDQPPALPPGRSLHAPLFLLSTVMGLLVVADLAEAETLEDWIMDDHSGDQQPPGPIERYLRQALSLQDRLIYGMKVDLEGMAADENDLFFIASSARFDFDPAARGIAGTVVGYSQLAGVSRLQLERPVETAGARSAATASDRGGNVFVRNPEGADAAAEPLPTQVYDQWFGPLSRGQGAAARQVFFQGQGSAALSLDAGGNVTLPGAFPSGSDGTAHGEIELEYVGSDGPQSVFRLPDEMQPPNGTLAQVALSLPSTVRIDTAARNEGATVADLWPKARYRLKFRQQGQGTVEVEAVSEVILSGSHSLIFERQTALEEVLFTLDGKEQTFHVDPLTTIVEWEEPAVTARGSGGVAEGNPGTGHDAVVVRGPWIERGPALMKGDTCAAEFALRANPPAGEPRYVLRRLRVTPGPARTADDGRRCLIGICSLTGFADPNDDGWVGFQEWPRVADGQTDPAAPAGRFDIRLDEHSAIVSMPPAPGVPWRVLHAPPVGVPVRIFLDEPAPVGTVRRGPIRVNRLEVLPALTGVLGDFQESGGGQPTTFVLEIDGFARGAYRIAAPLLDALGPAQRQIVFEQRRASLLIASEPAFTRPTAVEIQITVRGKYAAGPGGGTTFTTENGEVIGAVRLDDGSPLGTGVAGGLLCEAGIVLRAASGGGPAEWLLRPLRLLNRNVLAQVQRVDVPQRRLGLRIVRGPEYAGTVKAGDLVNLYFEPGTTDAVWNRWHPAFDAARKDQLPLEFVAAESVEVTLVPNADPPTAQAGPAVAYALPANCELFAWPAAAAADGTPPTRVSKFGGDDLATVWADRLPGFWHPQSRHTSKTTLFRLVAYREASGTWRAAGEAWNGAAFAWPDKGVKDDAPPGGQFSNQIIVDDALLQWNGLSLAANAFRNKDESAEDGIRPAISVQPRGASVLPLRYGWRYKLRVRAVYLHGEPLLEWPDHEPFDRAFADTEKLRYQDATLALQPFGGQFAAANGQFVVEDNTFLRLEPLPPPRIGWHADALPRAADASDEPARLWGGISRLWIVTLFDEAGVSTNQPQPPLPRLRLLAPAMEPVTAERCGALDMICVSESGARAFFEELKKYDGSTMTAPDLKPGRLPLRLPDCYAARPRFVLNGQPLSDAQVQPVGGGSPGARTEIADWEFYRKGGVDNDKKWPAANEMSLALLRPSLTDYGALGFDPMSPEAAVIPKWDAAKDELRLYVPVHSQWRVGVSTQPQARHADRFAMWRIFKQLRPSASREPWARHELVWPEFTMEINHIGNRPHLAPTALAMKAAERLDGATDVWFEVACQVHRASTGTLLIQAAVENPWEDEKESPGPRLPRRAWPDWLDAQPVPGDKDGKAHYGYLTADEKIFVDEFRVTTLPLPDNQSFPRQPDGPAVNVVRARFRHDLGDGRHHRVYYRALAFPRDPERLAGHRLLTNPSPGPYTWNNGPLEGTPAALPAPAVQPDLTGSARAEWVCVDVKATRLPDKPEIVDRRMIFQWKISEDQEADAWVPNDGTWSFYNVRTCGWRFFLARPWFSSGAEERLAILSWNVVQGAVPVLDQDVERYLQVVSRWGADPVFEKQFLGASIPGSLGLLDNSHLAPLAVSRPDVPPVEEVANDDPASPASTHPRVAADLAVSLNVYTPRFDSGRKLWACDVFIRPKRYCPFLNLRFARYQPYAIPGCALSEVAEGVEPVQAYPERTVDLQWRTHDRLTLDAKVRGVFPDRDVVERRLSLWLERVSRGKELKGRQLDLLWRRETGVITGCDLAGNVALTFHPPTGPEGEQQASYEGTFTLLPPPRPGWADDAVRIVIVESELLPPAYDPDTGEENASREKARTVFAAQARLPREALQALSFH